jgi:hypothetical protein
MNRTPYFYAACFFGSLQVYFVGKLFSETSTGLSFFAQFPSFSLPLLFAHPTFLSARFLHSRTLPHEPGTIPATNDGIALELRQQHIPMEKLILEILPELSDYFKV